ncbi:hypothetical protein ABZS29_20955 [Kribbella sp. NPDC005582]|uniref:hypothetical protein n=1 Tax=Kribbella sp. NPDC005582 TaxID=3156893 RepID=UPI0033A6FBBA
MHDIDRALFESEAFGEGEHDEYQEFGQPPERELALASELLEITTEAELDRFLGKLLSGALTAARGFAGSDAGKAVGGVLKSVAKQALPHLGQAVGKLGLQTEGLSAEDEEYEVARAFVRFADETADRVAEAAPGQPLGQVAQQAAAAAAQRHLPGLIRPPGPAGHGHGREGRWVRRGNRIIVFDA